MSTVPHVGFGCARVGRRGFLKQTIALGLGVHVGEGSLAIARMPGVPVRREKDHDDVLSVGLTPQLFLDDTVVESIKGLKRHLNRPKKAGLIEEADGTPWERGDQYAVVRDTSGRFHMTYRFLWWDPSVRDLHSSIGEDKAHWFRQITGYATSEEGIRWTKPALGLAEGPTGFRTAPREKWKDGVFVEPIGFSRENNLGYPIQLMQDLRDFGGVSDPKRRYLVNVLVAADTHPFAEIAESGLYFAAEVPDVAGDREWRKRLEVIWEGRERGPRGPSVRVAGFDDRGRFWFDCTQSSFGGFRRRGGRDIARFISRDLRKWEPEELVLPIADDESREPRDWVEYMDVRVMRVADFWLGQLIVFHGDRTDPQYEMPTAPGVWRKGTTEMRLIMSRDAGKSWSRVGGKEAWIPYHEEDDGYDRLVFTGSPVRVGDELWLYYGCWDGDHLTWNRDGTTYSKDRMRIGRTARAVLRWDGYGSLCGDDPPGEITTRPLRTSGNRLLVNAAAGKGSVRVELQDAEGKPLPGFALEDCDRLASDAVAQTVHWRRKSEVPEPARRQALRLRFDVQRADLYGFQFAAAEA